MCTPTNSQPARSQSANSPVRRHLRLLNQLAKVAEHASLTGAFSDGAVDGVEKYNAIIAHLNKNGYDLGDFFPPLPADANFDRVGLAAKLLAAFIDDEDEEQENHQRHAAHNIIIGQLGNIAELEKLKDLGRVIKESMAGWAGGPTEAPTVQSADANEAPTVQTTGQSIPMPDLSRNPVTSA